MWLPDQTIEEVEKVARFRYISKVECELWNAQRKKGELRLLTGWEWISRNGMLHQQGLKTRTAAYRDAYYVLIKREAAPGLPLGRGTLRLVSRRA